MARHFVTDLDLSAEEQAQVLDLALKMKANPEEYRTALSGKILGMIFAKNSTRTRVSFEAGIIQLGGQGIFLPSSSSQLGRGEPPSDTGQVLSRYLDFIMIRTFDNREVRELAEASSVPVINGLDDDYHPCQVLADLLTIKEKKGSLKGLQLVYVGDGNNMAHSLMLGGAMAGMNVRIICPEGYRPKEGIVSSAQELGEKHGCTIEVTGDLEAVAGADVVYTDVWASMGQEDESAKRIKAFAGYQVDVDMMNKAKVDAIFLHCLPAHRGEEVHADVIDGRWSVVFDEAENRMHAQKALMVFLAQNS